MFLLYISNTITNFKSLKTNLIYSDIMTVKKNRITTNFFSKVFVVRHKFHLNCYRLVKPKIL